MIPIDFCILGIVGDFNLVLKIFFVLAIITFVRQRITNNKLTLVIITAAVISMVFLYWHIFRVAYILYILFSIGIAGVLVDLFFVSSGGSPEEIMNKKSNTPGTPGGGEIVKRNILRKFGKRPGM